MPHEPDVCVILDCDSTLINSQQLQSVFLEGTESEKEAVSAILSPTLLALCVQLTRQKRLLKVVINTHQGIDETYDRMTGMNGYFTDVGQRRKYAQTVAWNVAQMLKDGIYDKTQQQIDVQVCLQTDICPPCTSNEEASPTPHELGYTAAKIKEVFSLPEGQGLTKANKMELSTRLGETLYKSSGLVESVKTTKLALIMKGISASYPSRPIRYIFVDDDVHNLNVLPTRSQLEENILEDEKKLRENPGPDQIRVLQNRLKILKDAPAVDDEKFFFEAYHFQHEAEARAGSVPEFTLYFPRAGGTVREKLSMDALVSRLPQAPSAAEDSVRPVTQRLPSGTGTGPHGLFAQSQGANVSASAEAIYQQYFKKAQSDNTGGLFYQYLEEREKTYAIKDAISRFFACMLGVFGYQTEREKRREFVKTLDGFMQNKQYQQVINAIEKRQPEFSSRRDSSQSLQGVLTRFNTALAPIAHPAQVSELTVEL
jgi:hypothetical protein